MTDSTNSTSVSSVERHEQGKSLRAVVPRAAHAGWQAGPERRNSLEILAESNLGRLPQLIPIRHGRMLQSPFTFFRGSAALMAYDLSTTPSTGIRVQSCGDCHLLNFGLFATPERHLVFDLNDFDETLPAPWEWDLKRLVASIVIAARDVGHSEPKALDAAVACAISYRQRLREFSEMSPLDVWYYRLEHQRLIEEAPDEEARERRKEIGDKARERLGEYLFPKITEPVGGSHRLVDEPPVLYHVDDTEARENLLDGLEEYRLTLPEERRVLLDRYRLEDFAVKVVGIGSVGTRCLIGLFFSEDNHPLLLQLKEARSSVLAPYAGASAYDNQGERVVHGQRLMQSASDIFLGWVRGRRGYDFYVRQLRDMKYTVPLEAMNPLQLSRYGEICAWTLARAHAKGGDAAKISGYLGRGDNFPVAVGQFAVQYADQNERDYAVLQQAERDGLIEVLREETK